MTYSGPPRDIRRSAPAGGIVSGGPPAFSPRGAMPPVTNATRSPLFDVGPHVTGIEAYFQRVTIQPLGSPDLITPTANLPVAFCLRSIRVPADLGSEAVYLGADGYAQPTDYNGVGIAGDGDSTATNAWDGTTADLAAKWGDDSGRSACILIGTNLGVPEGTWKQIPIQIPGVVVGNSINPPDPRDTSVGVSRPNVLDVAYFPAGSFLGGTSNPGQRMSFNRRLGVHRLVENSTLDALLVIRRKQYQAAPSGVRKVLCGMAYFQMYIATASPFAEWQGQ
jgi:hypothetical protein